MGWKARPKTTIRWKQPARLRASAGEPPEDGLPPEREQLIRETVLRRAVEEGLIPAHDLPSWERHAGADLFGTIEVLNEMEAARRGSTNGAVTAAAPRRDDGEPLIARAIAEGRFAASRADHWRAQFRRDPAGTRTLLTAPPESGGLVPLLTSSGRAKADEAASAIGAIHPKAAARLGYAVQLPHPLRPGDMPGRMLKPPPESRVHRVTDRA